MKHLRIVRSLPLILGFGFALGFASTALACPTCRDALADSPQGQGLAQGFYYSILFMMSMPFIVLGTLVSVAYRSIQRANVEQDGAPTAIAKA